MGRLWLTKFTLIHNFPRTEKGSLKVLPTYWVGFYKLLILSEPPSSSFVTTEQYYYLQRVFTLKWCVTAPEFSFPTAPEGEAAWWHPKAWQFTLRRGSSPRGSPATLLPSDRPCCPLPGPFGTLLSLPGSSVMLPHTAHQLIFPVSALIQFFPRTFALSISPLNLVLG